MHLFKRCFSLLIQLFSHSVVDSFVFPVFSVLKIISIFGGLLVVSKEVVL